MSSDFNVEVFKVGTLDKHPNADSLLVTKAKGFVCLVKKDQIQEGDLAVYIPEGAVVPLNQPAFEFLRKHPEDTTARIKAVRLRGIYSEGLIVSLKSLGINHDPPDGIMWFEGEDLAEVLGIKKYEQPVDLNSKIAVKAAQQERAPDKVPRYDMNPLQGREATFLPDEMVVCTEKIHGMNFRAGYVKGKLHVGSHNTFRREPFKPSKWLGYWYALKQLLLGSRAFSWRERFNRGYEQGAGERKIDPWWKVVKDYGLDEKLKEMEGLFVYGEVYGHVQDLTYSVPEKDVVHFAAFDIFDTKRNAWLPYFEFNCHCSRLNIPMAPELYEGPYKDLPMEKCSGKSIIDNKTLREGFVIRRFHETTVYGRSIFKVVSPEYKLRNKGTEFS